MLTPHPSVFPSPAFLRAGKASFVIANPKDESLTVKITRSKRASFDRSGRPYPPSYYVRVRWQNDPWQYAGSLRQDGTIARTPKSQLSDDHQSLKIAEWGVRQILAQTPPPSGYRIAHTGHCGRCGKLLRDELSIALGLGPVCRGGN